MRSAVYFVVLGLLAINICVADEIRVENRMESTHRYQLAVAYGNNWSQPHEIESSRAYVIKTTKPLKIRFSTAHGTKGYTVNPGRSYCFLRHDGDVGLFTCPEQARDEVNAKMANGAARAEETRVGPKSDTIKAKRWTGEIREFKVRVMADSRYRRICSSWKKRTQQIVSAASKRYESEFGIRLSVIDHDEWQLNSLLMDADERTEELLKVEAGDADLVIGFLGLPRSLARRAGEAMCFGQHVLVSDDLRLDYNRSVTILIHELGHVFGAFHVATGGSIMQPSLGDIPVDFKFGEPEGEAILLGRNADLNVGIDSLTEAQRARISLLYIINRHPTENVLLTPIIRGFNYRMCLAEMNDDERLANAVAGENG